MQPQPPVKELQRAPQLNVDGKLRWERLSRGAPRTGSMRRQEVQIPPVFGRKRPGQEVSSRLTARVRNFHRTSLRRFRIRSPKMLPTKPSIQCKCLQLYLQPNHVTVVIKYYSPCQIEFNTVNLKPVNTNIVVVPYSQRDNCDAAERFPTNGTLPGRQHQCEK